MLGKPFSLDPAQCINTIDSYQLPPLGLHQIYRHNFEHCKLAITSSVMPAVIYQLCNVRAKKGLKVETLLIDTVQCAS